jgi:hypothetical protein
MKRNRSKTYLLPLLSELIHIDPKYNDDIVNTYIFDDLQKYDNCMLILHNTNFRSPEFTGYENKLLNNEYFRTLEDIDEKHSLYVFTFPDDYLHEYTCFKQGKYSHFGEDAKSLMLEYWGQVYQNQPGGVNFLLKLKQVLFRDEKLRRQIEQDLSTPGRRIVLPKNAELASAASMEEETFELSKVGIT